MGSILFSYSNDRGTLVSQAGVAAVEPILSGRIFVDQAGTLTAIALVNPSSTGASVLLILRDAAGNLVDRKMQPLPAGGHWVSYVHQLFPNLPSGFTGSLTFESDQKLAAITLRESKNAFDEPLYSTLPVIDLGIPTGNQSLIFPQIAAGGGYKTRLILMNPTAGRLTGRITLTGADGNPLLLQFQKAVGSQFFYQIDPQGTLRAEFDNPAGVAAGYAMITPDPGNDAPAGTAIFQYKNGEVPVTEAGVPAATYTTSARTYVDNVGSFTGVAVANPENQPTTVTFSLMDRDGLVLDTKTRELPGKGHLANFVHEIFPGLPGSFTGLIEINSLRPVAPITLKLTLNDREEQILTTLPVADMTRFPSAASLIFPQFVMGGSFTSRLIVINANAKGRITGRIYFCHPNASPMIVPLGSKTGSEFPYEIAAGGGKQLHPGNTAKIARISLLDPATRQPGSEVVVNEGNSVRAPVLIIDATGMARDDFDVNYASLSTDVAVVDSSGNITGKQAGFSTLTISGDGVLATGTITVVAVQSGVKGIEIIGVTQDLSRKLYMANAKEHTILLARNLAEKPNVYAGVTNTPGLKDDIRLKSWFKNPSFLAINQSKGILYVSDKENHAIRRVQPGQLDKVDTLAGSGSSGSRDGSGKEASFWSPEGVALDNRGYLWVADSGNHIIRRINITTGKVETIAGKAGAIGWADGIGGNARFSSPTGIAFEAESIAQEIERNIRGLPPPPVSVVVADTGNGAIRRIKETGEVETVRLAGQGAPTGDERTAFAPELTSASPLLFSSPSGIAVDPLGNIYVTEPSSNRVRAILQNGTVVTAAQVGTLIAPKGLVATQSWQVVVADSGSLACEITHGKPEITGFTPDKVSNRGGEKVTVSGKNFSPESLIVVAGSVIRDRQVIDTQTIVFTVPPFPSGLTTLTVQNRGGLAQKALQIEPIPLRDLPVGAITTVVGGWSYYMGDGLPAAEARLKQPQQVALDTAGNLYIADRDHHRVRKVDAVTGIITTVAGTGEEGDPEAVQPDGIPALTYKLCSPSGVVIHPLGDLLIADEGLGKIIRISASTGLATVIAGNGTSDLGDGGPALQASLPRPGWLAVDSQGNIFVNDSTHYRIRKIDVRTDMISTVAGNGESGFSRDNVSAIQASLTTPGGIAVDGAGNLFIADGTYYAGINAIIGVKDIEDSRIRKVDVATGIITTVAGTGKKGYSGDGGPAAAAELKDPTGLAIDSLGNLFISDAVNNRIRKIDASSGIITTIAGHGTCSTKTLDDGGPAGFASICSPSGIAVDASGNVLFAEPRLPPDELLVWNAPAPGSVRRIDAATGAIYTIAGDRTSIPPYSRQEVPAVAATLSELSGGLSFDPSGNMFFIDGHWLYQGFAATGKVKGLVCVIDDDPNIPVAYEMTGVATDSAGNVFLAVCWGPTIFKRDQGIRKTGIFYSPPASEAHTRYFGIALDSRDNVFVADVGWGVIRKIDPAGTAAVIVAGGGDISPGDNEPATRARLRGPMGVAVDKSNNVFIADTLDHRIRRVDGKSGIITTIAGTGQQGYSGDGGPAKGAQLYWPLNLVLDGAGNVFVAESGNFVVRKIAAATGIITTVAGNGRWPVRLGDNEQATNVGLMLYGGHFAPGPMGVVPFYVGMAVDHEGNLYITDDYNERIRAIRGVGQAMPAPAAVRLAMNSPTQAPDWTSLYLRYRIPSRWGYY